MQLSEDEEVTETFEDEEAEVIEGVKEAKTTIKTIRSLLAQIQEVKDMNRIHLGTRVGLTGSLQIRLGNVSLPLLAL